jgi:hypothetical protein
MTLDEHPKLQEIKNMSGLSHPSNWKHVSPCPHARFVALGLPHKHHIERGRKRKREREFHQLNSTIYSTFFAGEPQFFHGETNRFATQTTQVPTAFYHIQGPCTEITNA